MPARLMRRFAIQMIALSLAAANVCAQPDNGSFIVDLPAKKPGAAENAAPAVAAAPSNNQIVSMVAKPQAERSEPASIRVEALKDEGNKPDESALRYYAALNQTQRANVEIQRLVRLYPGWVPPVDLFEMDVSTRDEDMLWDLYTADKLVELRAAIESRRKDEPGWQPSKDLVVKLRRKELRTRIVSFWKEGRWQDLVDFVSKDGYGDDADVDILWTIAEAYGRTKQTANAIGVYKSILTSANEPAARLATIQKAMSILRMADVEQLIAMGKTSASGESEFAPIMVDIIRQRISAFLHDERPETLPQDQLAKFQDFARQANDPNQPGLVAWYYYKTKAYRDALEWFKVALERGGDAMIAHGLAHSLRELDMRRETEEVAYAWREPLVNNLILFIDILERDLTLETPPYIEPERLSRYASVTMDVASGEGAQALAWYAYNSCQYPVALEWFQRAMAWFPKEATAYGYALTLRKMNRKKDFYDIVNRYDGLFGKVEEIIFPDNSYHPPTPCDIQANMRLRPAQQTGVSQYQQQAYVVPGASPGMANGYGAASYADPRSGAPAQIAAGAPAGAVPVPGYGAQQMPKIDPKDFPVSVDPENSLRYAAAAARAGGPPAPVFPAPAIHEPFRGPRPLTASRVPGIGAMPYERYGFALLPGWNGQTFPTSPTYAAQVAPAGTLWANETSEKDRPRSAPLAAAMAPQQTPTALPTSVPPASASPGAAPPRAPAAQPAASAKPASSMPSGAAGFVQQASLQDGGEQLRSLSSPARALLPQTSDPTMLAQRAQQYFNDKAYDDAIATLDQRLPLAPETTDLRMMRGWSLLHLKRAEEAREVFAGLKAAPRNDSGSR